MSCRPRFAALSRSDSISPVDRAAMFSFVHSIIKSTHRFDFARKFRSFSTFCVNFTSLAAGENADINIKQNGGGGERLTCSPSPIRPSEITFAAGSTPSAMAKSEPCGIANSILSVSDSWYRMTSHSRRYRRTRRAQKGSTREDHFMKIEIEYCGQ